MNAQIGGRSQRLEHRRGLDGLRALAVIAVVLYHSGFHWARGGFLGVTAFFVLSGFLITGLLLRERDSEGRVDLGYFWGRRARRLVPAVLLMTALIVGLVAIGTIRRPDSILGDTVAALAWVGNWRLVLGHSGYAGAFAGSSPFQHLWSLGVEEQFYLLLPPLLVLTVGRQGPTRRWRLWVVASAAVAASTLAMIALHHHGGPVGRAYYGTDARAAEPFVGVMLALALIGPDGMRRVRRTAVADVVGAVCLAGLAVLVGTLGERQDALYRGGFLLAAVLSAGVVFSAVQPGSLIERALSVPPLTALGRISYGVYLYHWPLFLWITTRRTGLHQWQLLALRSAVTLVVAAVSYALIEQPIRAGRLPGKVAVLAWMDVSVAAVGSVVVLTVSSAVIPNAFAAGVAPTDRTPHPTVVANHATVRLAAPGVRQGPAPMAHASPTPAGTSPGLAASVRSAGASRRSTAATRQLEAAGPDPNLAPPIPASPSPGALRVAIVGDSLANNLGSGLDQWARGRTDVVVYNLAIPACPISRGGQRELADGSDFAVNGACAWWADPGSARSAALAQFNPQLVVMQDGANELPDRKVSGWSDYQHSGQPQFDAWLLGEYRAATSAFTAQGAKFLTLNAACADWETIGGGWAGYADNSDGDHRVASLDRTSSALAGYGATNGDLFSHLCPNGKFVDSVDGVSNARPDGYHLSSAAALAVARQWLGPLILSTGKSTAQPVVTPPGH